LQNKTLVLNIALSYQNFSPVGRSINLFQQVVQANFLGGVVVGRINGNQLI
jgi:hypothetical protein